MTQTWVAFLRGINLGQRQINNADLRAAYVDMGFANVRTLIASGNIIFDAAEAPDRAAVEKGFADRFGFQAGTVLRTQDELRQLVAADPFGGRVENADTKLYVTFLAEPVAGTLPMPCAEAGDFEVMHLTEREIFILAFRLPTGRYGLGMERVWKHFGKRRLWTSRNWNTVLKAAK